MIHLKLIRRKYTDKQTVGTMAVIKDNVFVCSFATLELDWENNKQNNSCIPPSNYSVNHYSSEKYPKAFEVLNVPNRSGILIHNGSYNTSSLGCILIGYIHSDINQDGYLDVIHSKDALSRFNDICAGEEIISLSIT